MKLVSVLFVVTCWTVLAFQYRFAMKRGAPTRWVSASAALSWLLSLAVVAVLKRPAMPALPSGFYAIAVLGGVSAAACLPLFMEAVSRGNLTISWTILTLSFAAASLAAVIYPGETLHPAGVMGLGAAAIAILLLAVDSLRSIARGEFRRGYGVFMLLAFITNGLTLYVYALAKASAEFGPLSHKLAYLVTQTATFLLVGAAICAHNRRAQGKAEAIAHGAFIGLTLFLGNYGATVSIGNFAVPPYIFYPASSGGSTITVALLSALVYRERPGRWGWLGLAAGLGGMLLLGTAA